MKKLALLAALTATSALAGTIAPTVQTLGVVWDSNTTVAAATVPLLLPPWSSGRVISCSYYVTGGSFTATLKIGSTAVTGCTPSVSSATPTTSLATAANTFAAGDSVTLVISGITGTPTTSMFQINLQATAN